MAQRVGDVMTPGPIILRHDQLVADAARVMRDQGVGLVLVTQEDRLYGVLTDRDIVVRAIAESGGPDTELAAICSRHVVAVNAGDDIAEAVRLMRENTVRRLPVIDNGQVVGLVSLGDLAARRDDNSALADISAAEPNA
jgi:signal-transduction protein with cAMP-binding, CBS, and nucleotidyltransferase domain